MANLSTRKLDEDTIARLRIRAAHHLISMEEEARRVLRHLFFVTPFILLGAGHTN
jgi:plasmid stability protein